MVLVWSVGLCRFDHDVKGKKKGKKRKRKKEAIGEKEGAANSFVPSVSLRIDGQEEVSLASFGSFDIFLRLAE